MTKHSYQRAAAFAALLVLAAAAPLAPSFAEPGATADAASRIAPQATIQHGAGDSAVDRNVMPFAAGRSSRLDVDDNASHEHD